MAGECGVSDGRAGRLVDLSVLPARVADAVALLVAEAAGRDGAVTREERPSRERLGDVVQAAEAVKGFAESGLLDAASALVEDVAVDHGVAVDDPRYAEKVAAHRRGACRAVVHEVQLLTGSTLTAVIHPGFLGDSQGVAPTRPAELCSA